MNIGTRTSASVLAAIAAIILVLSGCTSAMPPTVTATEGRTATYGAAVLGQDDIAPLLKALPKESIGASPQMKLATGLVPPTNKWFSALVFAEQPTPVFPLPLSFQETPTGFTAGLPTATATKNTLFGQAVAQIALDLGPSTAVVSRYDNVSVTIEHRAETKVIGHTTIAEGSPLVSYTAATAGTVTLNAPVSSTGTTVAGGQTWGVAVTGGTMTGATVTLRAKGSIVLFPVPAGASQAQTAALLRAAAAPLTAVTTSYSASKRGQKTTLTYHTATRTTLVVPLPHQGGKAAASPTASGSSATCSTLSYKTIYGTLPVCVSPGLAFTTPTVKATSALDLTTLSQRERAEVRTQLRKDVAASPAFATDTYYGGKSLYRSAMLLQLARSLGDTASVRTLTSRLTDSLDRWTQPGGCTSRQQECFVYDPTLKSVVGLAPSFGSELDNDHHFHYGYFLYAAGVVAQNRPALAAKWAPVMDLLAADIASDSTGATGLAKTSHRPAFPDLRVFDPYFSHSWASGFSIFTDGNNQESSSEAANAWAGLSLWAAASKNKPLAAEAAWLLSAETASALAYFVNPDLAAPQLSGYSHDLVSLNWGGKRDFGTWFSAAPSAIIGIQLIPMSPTSTYLASPRGGGAEHIESLSSAALARGLNSPLGDYVLMYMSLAGEKAAKAALTTARALPTSSIDGGDSRSYLLAYIMIRTRTDS